MMQSLKAAVIFDSVLTCPHCGYAKHEHMPADACQFFYECENCKALLRPHPGDCCVFCSFGSIKCPSIQAQGRCCGDGLGATDEVDTAIASRCS